MTGPAQPGTDSTPARHQPPAQPGDVQGWVKELQADQKGYGQGFNGTRYQTDIANANTWLAKNGLSDFQITGVQGQGLVGRDKQNNYVVINPDRTTTPLSGADSSWKPTTNGHYAQLNPDGSGHYAVDPSKDTSGVSLASSILKDRGITNPSQTQIANFERDILRANGQSPTNLDWFRHMQPHQSIAVPPVVGGVDSPTHVTPGVAPNPLEVSTIPVQVRDAKSPVNPPGLNAGGSDVASRDAGDPVRNRDGSITTKYSGNLNDNSLWMWLGGSQTHFDATKTVDSKGVVAAHVDYKGEGASFSIKNPDGTAVDLTGVSAVDIHRGRDGNYTTTYKTAKGDYTAVSAPDGSTKSLVQGRIPGVPTTIDVPLFPTTPW